MFGPVLRTVAAGAPGRLLLAALALLAPTAAAQEPDAAAANAAPSSEAPPPEGATPAATGGFADPRAAFRGYLETLGRHRSDLAVDSGLFDLVADEVDERRRLAGELYAVLLRAEHWPPDRLTNAGDARSPVSIPVRAPEVGLYERLSFERGTDGRWRLAARNADWIGRAFEAVAELPLREEVIEQLDTLERWHQRLRAELPPPLRARAFVLENWQWLAIGVVLLGSVVLGHLARFLLALLARRATGADGVLHLASELQRFNRPTGLFVSAALFGGLLPLTGLEGQVLAAVAFAARFVATFAGLWAIYRAVDLGCGILEERARASATKFDDILVPLLRTTLHVFVAVVGIVYLAAEWTDQLWSVVAGLSIGSLAVGFAARDSIENLFGTFTVLVDKPFALGDWIVVDGIEGTVESVGFRSTKIRTFWDSIQSVPNRRFISSVVQNYGHRRKRRIKTTLRLALDTPADLVDAFCEGVRQLIRRRPTSVPANHVYLHDLGSDALEVLLYTFVETPDWSSELREKHGLLADVLRLAERLGIRLAAPARTVALEERERRSPTETGDAAERLGRDLADAVVDRTP